MAVSVTVQDAARECITEMVRRIVDRFHPEKIILFGSHARGTAASDSDADLLVVMRVEGSRRKQATEIDLALAGIRRQALLLVARTVVRDDFPRTRGGGRIAHESSSATLSRVPNPR